MRNLFLVGAKLLGIFFFFWAITAFFQTISGLLILLSTSKAEHAGLWAFIAALLFSLLLNFNIDREPGVTPLQAPFNFQRPC